LNSRDFPKALSKPPHHPKVGCFTGFSGFRQQHGKKKVHLSVAVAENFAALV